ncbi:MAG: hypothetical protein NC390_00395 [Fusobacterium sp.]|nr:hypothetical protein [Fusobacterium sp.]
MLINNLPKNNPVQNFGFKVKVKEHSKLVDMADSYLFRTVPREAIDAFEKKAAEILPDRNVHIEYSIWKSEPNEAFEAKFFTDGDFKDSSIGHDAKGLFNSLRKATNPYVTLHSKLFYDGQKSPETLSKVEHFRETYYRPFNKNK